MEISLGGVTEVARMCVSLIDKLYLFINIFPRIFGLEVIAKKMSQIFVFLFYLLFSPCVILDSR